MKRDIRIFLEDIRESMERIEEYTYSMNEEHFMGDIRTQDAIIRRLEIIGEAAKNIPEGLRGKYPENSLETDCRNERCPYSRVFWCKFGEGLGSCEKGFART